MQNNITKSKYDDNPDNGPLARALWLIGQLGGDSRTGKCFCPSHDDEPNPSFDVSLTSFTAKGQPLFTCRAGCEQDAVIAALLARGLWPIPGTLPPISATQPVQHRTAEERRQYALKIFKGVKAHDWDRSLAEDYFRKRGLKTVPRNAWLTMPVPKGDDERRRQAIVVATKGKWRNWPRRVGRVQMSRMVSMMTEDQRKLNRFRSSASATVINSCGSLRCPDGTNLVSLAAHVIRGVANGRTDDDLWSGNLQNWKRIPMVGSMAVRWRNPFANPLLTCEYMNPA